MKVELSYFMIGALQENLNIPPLLIDQTIKLISDPSSNILLKLRALWLLEKLSSNRIVKKNKESVGR